MHPNNRVMVMMGVGLLWVGWFGFNAGSSVASSLKTAQALTVTQVAASTGALTWLAIEALHHKKATSLGFCSGMLAGLVAITPAAGNVGLMGALVVGAAAGFACLWGVNGLKKILGADDSLDVFGVHGVGGIVGALLTGIFNNQALGGPGMVTDWVTATVGSNAIWDQLLIQARAVALTVVWSGVVSFVAYKVVDMTLGLRVSEEDEREGLDIAAHGETAYHR
jgi:Amt family ammonium transporter